MNKNLIKLIRSLLVCLFFIIFGLGALVIRYFVFPVQNIFIKSTDFNKLKYSETLQKSWYFMILLLKISKIIKINADVEKLKNIKNKIIVSTHPSFLDIVILISIIPHSTCFVAQKLTKNPFFRGIVKLLFIPEGQNSEKWTADACEILDNEMNIIIFPMGGRHKQNETPKIRRGASLLALKSKKNIIALKIDSNSDFLRSHKPFYEAGSEPTVYDISYVSEINVEEFIKKYPDEVTFKTELTKEIGRKIYS